MPCPADPEPTSTKIEFFALASYVVCNIAYFAAFVAAEALTIVLLAQLAIIAGPVLVRPL